MKTSNAEEIRLKGVEIWFFTPFFVFAAEWWNIHTQFNNERASGFGQELSDQYSGRHTPSYECAGGHTDQQDLFGGREDQGRGSDLEPSFPGTPSERLHSGNGGRGHGCSHPRRDQSCT